LFPKKLKEKPNGTLSQPPLSRVPPLNGTAETPFVQSVDAFAGTVADE
jgi:hypothetical protein